MIRGLSRFFRRDRDRPFPAGEIAAEATPRFQPLNRLEEMLVAAAHDPGQRGAFHDRLLASTLYAASPDLPASRGMALPPGMRALRLVQAKDADGERLPVLFTAQARLVEAFGNAIGFFAADGERMIGLVADRGALLNPGFGYGVRWTAADCAGLLGRPVERRREQDVQLLLGAPSDPPQALIAALRGALAGDPAIDGAWLALAQWPGRDGMAWYCDIRTTLDRTGLERRLEPVFRTADLGGRPLDLVVLPPGGEGAGIRLAGAD